VHQRRARSHHYTIQALIADILLDKGLTWIRAHISVVARDLHITQLGGVGGDRFYIDYPGDVRAAMADVDADSWTKAFRLW
jgi:hypothetical protein